MKKNGMKRPLLLAPVGDWASLHAALDNGADGVYLGVTHLNMRDNARSFELNELPKVVFAAHAKSCEVNLTLNAIVLDDELERAEQIICTAKAAGIDAVICWDMALVNFATKYGMRVHLSTQASVANYESLRYYASLGVKRVVLARECTLAQIKTIKEKMQVENLDVELEAFIHGAMCISISGRCFISEYLYGESANRGRCLQPCRRKYHISDLEGEAELEIGDGYVMSPKDMCALPFLDKVIAAGVDAFKIEGRMRSPEYVATVTRVYRNALDDYYAGALDVAKKDGYMKDLAGVYNRGFSEGFYFGMPVSELIDSSGSVATTRKRYIGEVRKFYTKISVAEVFVRNDGISVGDSIVFMGNATGVKEQVVSEMQVTHKPVARVDKGEIVAIKCDFPAKPKDKVFVITRAKNQHP